MLARAWISGRFGIAAPVGRTLRGRSAPASLARLRSRSLRRLDLVARCHLDERSHRTVILDRVPQWHLAAHLVTVSPPIADLVQVPALIELCHDALNRTLRDPNLARHVPKPHTRCLGNAQEHVGVVRQERPAGVNSRACASSLGHAATTAAAGPGGRYRKGKRWCSSLQEAPEACRISGRAGSVIRVYFRAKSR